MIWKLLRGPFREVDLADLCVFLFTVFSFLGNIGCAVGALLAAFYVRLRLIQRAIEKTKEFSK